MSRIIIKNLPNGITDAKLKNHFSKTGVVTDVQLKYTAAGKFRNFGFIGYDSDEEALKSIQYFNNTYLRTSKISVELCAALNDSKKPKAWSKYAQENQVQKEEEQPEEPKQERVKKETASEIYAKHKDEPLFKEFLNAHTKKNAVWDNNFDPDENEDKKDSGNEEEEEGEEEEFEKKSVDKKKEFLDLFVVKVMNLSFNAKRKDLIKFFRPLKTFSIRIPPKIKGFAYVGFKTEEEMQKALLKDKSFLGGKQVHVVNFTANDRHRALVKEKEQNPKWIKQKESFQSESICESGKLFFRNLAYSVNEESVQELFEKFGPVAEIDVPIDTKTRRLKGFGTVTFLMPEHAVQAYSILNGTLFHGRMFHIMPGSTNDKDDADEDSKLSFKERKEKQMKKAAGSSFNWNTLFMGENAVADAMSKKYDTSKEDILDSGSGKTSAAVRLALGETELVMEMRKFLETNDICLESFNRVAEKRSNTVILAKNLPANTTASEIKKIFVKFGLLGRVIMPPSGITAVIEFLEPTEAKVAFKKLAYTRFKDLPLYLEWAPEKAFNSAYDPDKKPVEELKRIPFKKVEPIVEEDDGEPPEEGTTLFMKNLNFVTRENDVREKFKHIGPIHSIQVVMKGDESRGYGFIQFKTRKSTELALKNMQFCELDGKQIELARSDRTLKNETSGRKTANMMKQTGTKILVRNIPFQANHREIKDLFKAFGEIKTLRLPKKMTPGEDAHRGFCFVDYTTKSDAKTAFDTLCHSTHLYGRRLVLEWAAEDDGVEELRKRTADKFTGSNIGAKRSRKGVFDTADIEDPRQERKEMQGGALDDNDDDDDEDE